MLIQTKFHGPTDCRGARISARDVETGRRIVRGYRYELSGSECHRVVASELAGRDDVVEAASGGAGRWWTVIG